MSARPPRLAEWLLERSLPAADREAAAGDLAEEFADRRAAGAAGRRWYWSQVVRSLPSNIDRRFHGGPPRGPETQRRHRFMETLLQDLRYGLRGLRRNPAFAVIVAMTLAVGIAANTVIFSFVDGVVLRPFPFPEPERLVGVGTAFPKLGSTLAYWENLSPAEYLDIAEGSRTLDHVVAWDMGNRQVTVGDATENLFSGFWWGDAFRTLGIQAALGRGFLPEEIEGGEAVAILSHRVWLSRFGGDPSMIGGKVLVNGGPYTLVGIMPPRTQIYGTDLWIPMPITPGQFPRNRRQFQVLARVAEGATLEQATAELETIARRVEADYRAELPEYEGWRLVPATWNDINVANLKPAALISLGAVAFVLLLVCANVASLLLARSSSRRRELAVRVALGAGRARVIRQLLTESIVLALFGGLLGVGLGWLGVRGVHGILQSMPLPIPGDVALNARVLFWITMVAVATGVAFGLAPAIQASRFDVQRTLQTEGQSVTGGAARLRLQRIFVGAEVALALVLLVGGGLLVHSFIRLQRVDPGLRPDNVLTMRLTLPRERYGGQEVEAFFRQLVERVQTIPGVTSAGTASQFPPGVFSTAQIQIEGADAAGETLPTAFQTLASPGYFETLGIPLRAGRVFTEDDVANAPPVAVINEATAARFFPDGNALGRRIRVGGPESRLPWMEVIGVVGSTRNRGLDADPAPEVFGSTRQLAGAWNQLFLLIRTSVDPRSVLPGVRAEVKAMDPEQPVYLIRTLEEAFAGTQQAAIRRVSMTVLATFAAFALLLAAVGIYAVSSYAVSQRTREIGLRIALGAERQQVRGLMVRQALLPVALGALVGLGGAVALGRVMSSLLYEVSGTDPLTIAAVASLLTIIALAASWLPARRASNLDPTAALRQDGKSG